MKLLAHILSTIIFWGIRFYQKFLNPMLKAIGGTNSGCRLHLPAQITSSKPSKPMDPIAVHG